MSAEPMLLARNSEGRLVICGAPGGGTRYSGDAMSDVQYGGIYNGTIFDPGIDLSDGTQEGGINNATYTGPSVGSEPSLSQAKSFDVRPLIWIGVAIGVVLAVVLAIIKANKKFGKGF